MEVYYCPSCDYTNKLVADFKKHLNSKKHIESNKNAPNKDVKLYKKKIFECEICNITFFNKMTKSNHIKQCHSIELNSENKNSSCVNLSTDINAQIEMAVLKKTVELMQNQIDIMSCTIKSSNNITEKTASALEKTASATEKTAEVANKSMNILKRVQIQFPDAPPLKKLKKEEAYSMLGYDNPNMTEEENENFVRLVLANYDNKNIANFFGNLIVNYYKEDDVKNVRFWSSDVARLCFVIMRTVEKENKNEWFRDKSGSKFTEMVLFPMFDALNIIFGDFLKFKEKWNEKYMALTKGQMDFLIETRQKCMELSKDIRYDKFTKPILSVVASEYDFDTYKKIVDIELISLDSNLNFNKKPKQLKLKKDSSSSSYEKPVKKNSKIKSKQLKLKKSSSSSSYEKPIKKQQKLKNK